MSAGKREYAGGAGARYALLGSVVFLTILGLVMIYSASSITARVEEGSSYYYLFRQGIAVAIGIVFAAFFARRDYRVISGQQMLAAWGVTTALLLIPVLGTVTRGGAKRWIIVGGATLQPSEFAKIACVVLVAWFAVDWARGRCSQNQFLTRSLAIISVPALLIFAGKDLGTLVILVVGVVSVLFLAGIPLRYLFTAGGVAGGLAALAILFEPYRLRRFTAFLNPWADPLGSGYHAIQAMLAFGSGGVSGVGLGLSRQKFFYLPEAHTDFILAIIGEEAGLIGTLAVAAAFAVLVWAGIRISLGARDLFGRLLAGALTVMLGFQALLNMGAVTGLIPITGKPLPFLSYGGSSIWATMICVGLLLSISENGALAPRGVASRKNGGRPPRESTPERWRDGGSRPSGSERRRTARRRA